MVRMPLEAAGGSQERKMWRGPRARITAWSKPDGAVGIKRRGEGIRGRGRRRKGGKEERGEEKEGREGERKNQVKRR